MKSEDGSVQHCRKYMVKNHSSSLSWKPTVTCSMFSFLGQDPACQSWWNEWFFFSSSSSPLQSYEKCVFHTVWPHFLNLPPDLLIFLSMTLLNQDIFHFLYQVRRGLGPDLFLLLFFCKTPQLRFIALSSDQHLISLPDNRLLSQFFLQLPPYKATVWRVSGLRYYPTLTTNICNFRS